jgi:RimJ/RimL family protein N-acetyltransferase
MLIGERVRLRAIEREDLPAFVRWFNDPEVRQYLLFHTPMSMAEEERWFEGLPDRGDYVYAVDALVEGEWVHIGSMGLHHVDWKNGSAEFGVSLGEKAYWGQGYGTEATCLILRFAFEELRLNRVQLDVYEFNPRAIRCYEKAGFKHEGTRRQALYRDGQHHDMHVMGILRAEYQGKGR